jgi:sec-independent protein translocase protein TatA
MGLGTGEIILIFLVVMVVFGATKLPQLGDGLGKAIRNFKRSVNSANEIDVSPKKPEIDAAKSAESQNKPSENSTRSNT